MPHSTPTMIVTAPGSLGDVNPMLAIARELQHTGEQVLFLAAERYLPLAQRAGLQSQALVSEAQFTRLASHPQLWHPRHGARLLFQEAVEHFLDDHFNWLQQHCDPQRTTLVSHVLDFAGRVYRDAHPQTRFVSVLPAPALLRSSRTPPRLSAHGWESWIPHRLYPLLYRCADLWVDRIGGRQINALRARHELPPVSRILDQWWWSPDLVLGLFPEWYSIAPQDRPAQLQLVGFPLADSADVVEPHIAHELSAMWHTFAGDKPLVFAPGTAHEQAKNFLAVAADVCHELDVPGLLISSNANQFPKQLPRRVVTAGYIPFSQLLPSAAAIVHHGGVGTTSQALRAGIPQIVVPMAFDQFDNAQRVHNLSCGSWLPMKHCTRRRLLKHLRRLPQVATHCAAVARQLATQPAATELAVQKILQLKRKPDQ